MADYQENYLVNLMDKNPSGFLNILNRNIVKGDNAKEETLKQLGVISSHPHCDQLLRSFRDTYGDSLIHNVAKFHRRTDVIKQLLRICPDLTLVERTDRFAGQTALHIVVTKGNLKAARVVLKSVRTDKELSELLHTKATGTLFANNVMMGELALSVAALTLHTPMVDLLLKHNADISRHNSLGDTVFHSLIRFASIHPENTDSVIAMIAHINAKLPATMVSGVWYHATNRDNLTALKLAASLGQVRIFSSILKLEDVYCKLNHHDGLFDVYLFDITEIDTITQAEWERNVKRQTAEGATTATSNDKNSNSNKNKHILLDGLNLQKQAREKPAAQSHRPALIHRSPAVLDIICRMPTSVAFDLMSVDVVKDVITTKWTHYRRFYYLWFLCHSLFLTLISIYAVFKTHVINKHLYSSTNSTSPSSSPSSSSDGYETTPATDSFVSVSSVVCCVYAVPYLIYEAFRTFYFRQAWHLWIIHHNGLYRLMMVAMATSLIADTVWFWICPDNNYFLVVALLVGWTFMNFFLRALKIFSFFTVMLQKVLLGDMTRFSVIILFQLIAFSIGMHITFLNTRPIPPGFDNVGVTMMTMFKLMLGLEELDVLYDARHPWMAIALFITCVLVTYVLLLNSLIALMSQTCALVSEDRRMQWELQRLSVIHLVETMLLPRWRHLHKPGLKARRYNLHNQATEWRCFNEITSIQTTYTDGAAIFRRKSMIRTVGFGDSGLSPLTPFIDKFRMGRTNNNIHNQNMSIRSRAMGIYQHPATLRGGMIEEVREEENDRDSSSASSSSDEEILTTNPRPQRQSPAVVPPIMTPVESQHYDNNDDKIRNLPQQQQQRREGKTNDGGGGGGGGGVVESGSSASKNRKRSVESVALAAKEASSKTSSPPDHYENLQVVISPRRRRHNSDRVNRKTQTVQTNPLSHSFPDGSLRKPLHRDGGGNEAADYAADGGRGSITPPRIVYVVPTAMMNQHQIPNLRGVRADYAGVSNAVLGGVGVEGGGGGGAGDNIIITPQHYTTTTTATNALPLHGFPFQQSRGIPGGGEEVKVEQERDVYAQVLKPKVPRIKLSPETPILSKGHHSAASDYSNFPKGEATAAVREARPDYASYVPSVRFQGKLEGSTLPQSSTTSKVQQLDIDTLNSSA